MAEFITHTEYETVERVRANAGLWDAPRKPEYKHHLTGEDTADPHLERMLLGHQVSVPITKGKLNLGPWERVHYGEFDGRRPKRILLKAMGVAQCVLIASLVLISSVTTARAEDWPVFAHDPSRTGVDVGGTAIDASNVHRLHMRWQISLGSVADSTPIFLERVQTRRGFRPMLFQTGKSGVTYGIDALTGRIRWRFSTHGPNITTSTPAADPSGLAIYVPGVDGMVHKLDAPNGRETGAPGFPARITRMTQTEKDASALNLANGYLYATTSGYYGDAPPYIGHVVSVRLSDGATHVFNTLCSTLTALPEPNSCPASDSGIWSRGGAVVDPDPSMHGAVYAATGNGEFDVHNGGHDYGDSIVGLSADVTELLGHYTPSDYAQLDSGDVDMGSTSPVVLPRQPASRTPLMIAQGGKDAILRLINRAPLPGVAHELQEISLPSGLFSTPAVWTVGNRTWLFVGLPQAVDAYVLVTKADGESRLRGVWRSHAGSTNGEGTSPVVSNGVVFVAFDNQIVALNARDGRMLWSSAQRSALRSIGPVHWESPIVVGGAVYCSDENGHLTAYSLH
ncbi:MAG TPA: PQQ-binding-like beta-propeller repeat protein [Candidatus Baltobacteraceae bacterium]|jgi:outer membrane protein assembly factor BamB|nr:PQQ-binding-like beta-propeller repeat protein [Candidatus Baltobacteraceae bacterium]